MPMYTHVCPCIPVYACMYYKLFETVAQNLHITNKMYVHILVYWYTHKVFRKHGPKSCHIWGEDENNDNALR